MKIGEIIQKLKDLYGWDKGNLFYFSSKREFYKSAAEIEQQKMVNAKSDKEYKKAKFKSEMYMAESDRNDFKARNIEADQDLDNWKKERRDRYS